MKDGHVTLEDVAKRARVSVSTASRALAGFKVNKKNAQKVQRAAADLGYVMNEAARSLRNVRTQTVGLVFHELTGAFGIELLSSISSRLDAHGYCVFVATAQGENERYDKLVHRFLERRVDALLCVHGAGTGAALNRFVSAG
ncbi:MAG TPA: LacI family DNA-binding transcriptional regulator, partial [Steroidobacteraceae bacterium]|nr:LacI family DNA-binding transcriptional regulator [Steroidobacteraceae bacterium]